MEDSRLADRTKLVATIGVIPGLVLVIRELRQSRKFAGAALSSESCFIGPQNRMARIGEQAIGSSW